MTSNNPKMKKCLSAYYETKYKLAEARGDEKAMQIWLNNLDILYGKIPSQHPNQETF